MGFWDVFDNAVKNPVTKACQITCDLGRAAVSKSVEGAVKIPTVANSVVTSSCDFGWAAVSKIGERVRIDGVKQKVKEYSPGPGGREKIVQAFTHPATMEAVKLVAPGGVLAAINLVGSVLLSGKNHQDEKQNKFEHVMEQLKVLQAQNERMQAQNERMHRILNDLINNSSSSGSNKKVRRFCKTSSSSKL